MKNNKWLYFWVVQGKYPRKWEDLTYDETYRDGRRSLKDYQLNDYNATDLRLIRRKELNPDYKEN